MLALLFDQPSRGFFTTELIELTGSGAVQRELKRLTSSGLVNVTLIGKRKHYQADPVSAVFDELRGLVLKTVAMVQPIRQALEPLADRVSLAPVYGSVAKGTHTASSDIDLLLAGFNMSQGASDIPALDPSTGPGGFDPNTAYPQGYLASTEDR